MNAPVHATAVARRVRGGPGAVLLLGPSGAGKSLLAARLIHRGWLLVADDRVVLTAGANGVLASPPPALAGLMEVRGVGVLRVPWLPSARVLLAVDLGARAERAPAPIRWRDAAPADAGADLPYIRFDAAAPAAEHRLEAAFARALEAA